MAVVRVSEEELSRAVTEVLDIGDWPIYHTQDDNGLDRQDYLEFTRDVMRKLGLVAPTEE